jgi:uncharacterized protein (TIGR02996 family)
MSEDAGFVKAIQADPEDTALRLVYADWLDERGDDRRGEYLRLGCELARLSARREELRRGMDPAWLAAVRERRRRGNELRLRTGRTICLRSLDQHEVYAGLLEGLPTREMNERIIERTLDKERGGPQGAQPFLIRPRETPIEYHRDRPYPFGEPAALPGVCCVGRVTSLGPAAGKAGDYSALSVVWFQDEFALPVDPPVLDQLLAIDWDEHAGSYEY